MTLRADYTTVSPDGYRAFGAVYATLQKSALPKQLVDLVYLRVSQLNGCAFCIDMHGRDLLAAQLPIDKLLLVQAWREAGQLFDAREQAAFAWAESVTLVAQSHVSDADYAAVAAVFDEKEIVDLTYAIGLMNAFNRLGVAFRSVPAAVAKL